MELDPQSLLSSLSDATRLRLVYLLKRHGELCVCVLVDALDTPQPKVSKHLAVLRKNGIILGRRQGQWIHYRINPDLHAWADNILDELVEGCISRAPYGEDEGRLLQNRRLLGCA